MDSKLPEVESRTQGSRPRTQKKSEDKAKDSLSEDRHSRSQGQECSRPRPRTQSASALQKKKKRSSQKFFKRSPRKNAFQKIFQPLHKILTFQKIVLSSSRGQANFRGLDLQGQGLQNLSSRTPPLQITASRISTYVSSVIFLYNAACLRSRNQLLPIAKNNANNKVAANSLFCSIQIITNFINKITLT